MKIFILMPAYNAAKKIVLVFERMPKAVWEKHPEFVIVNDGSTDNTMERIAEIQSRFGDLATIHVIDKKQNQGYAQAQKDGYTFALLRGADIVAMLHADGQYAPEILPTLLRPLEAGEADIVQGSRMMDHKAALRGGMPVYKFVANVGLSTLENLVYGLHFSEYHSGYMLYSRKALQTIPFKKLSNTFHFDGEMLFVGAKRGLRVKEISIPTLYEDEVSHVKPVQYGFHVLGIMGKYVLGKYDFKDE
jgi:glycosyltransferase involved in cell wall biosynthesis